MTSINMNTVLRLILIASFMLLVSCGDGADNDKAAAEKLMEDYASAAGIDVDVELSGDDEQSVRINNLGVGDAVVGNNLSLPDGFPADVSIPPSLKIFSVNQMMGGFMLTGQSDSAPAELADFFNAELTQNGWESGSEGSQVAAMQALRFTKDNRLTNIMLIPAGDAVSVQLSTMPMPE